MGYMDEETTSDYTYRSICAGHMGRAYFFDGFPNQGGTFICEANAGSWKVQPKVGDTFTVTRDYQGVPIRILVNGVFAWEYTKAERLRDKDAEAQWVRERMEFLQGKSTNDPGIHNRP